MHLKIRVSATNLATTGSYNLNLECLFPTSSPGPVLTCGTRSAGQIEAAGDIDLFSFTGEAGQIISLEIGWSAVNGANKEAVMIAAREALARLRAGNLRFASGVRSSGILASQTRRSA